MEIPSLAQMGKSQEEKIIEEISSKLENFTKSEKEQAILIALMEKGYDPFTIAQVLLSDKLGKSTKTRHEKIDGIDIKKTKKSNKPDKSKKSPPKYNDENMATLFTVSYTHLTLPTTLHECRSRWSPYH